MKAQPNKPPRRLSDNVYIILGLVNQYGAAAWMILAMASVTVLIEYGWVEEKGGMIVAGILMLSIPVSFILTGLFDLLGGIFKWKGTLCAVQSMYHQKMDPRKSWNAKYRRDMIIVGCIFTVLGTALLLAWIFGV
ncbi:MAG: hypothetical protein J6R82_02570 [Clostridia bacterium]|nr:hypothetical protein [Clostridia bacterium]